MAAEAGGAEATHVEVFFLKISVAEIVTFTADIISSGSQHKSFVITVIEVAGGALPPFKRGVKTAASAGSVTEFVAFLAGLPGTHRRRRATCDGAERNECHRKEKFFLHFLEGPVLSELPALNRCHCIMIRFLKQESPAIPSIL